MNNIFVGNRQVDAITMTPMHWRMRALTYRRIGRAARGRGAHAYVRLYDTLAGYCFARANEATLLLRGSR